MVCTEARQAYVKAKSVQVAGQREVQAVTPAEGVRQVMPESRVVPVLREQQNVQQPETSGEREIIGVCRHGLALHPAYPCFQCERERC